MRLVAPAASSSTSPSPRNASWLALSLELLGLHTSRTGHSDDSPCRKACLSLRRRRTTRDQFVLRACASHLLDPSLAD